VVPKKEESSDDSDSEDDSSEDEVLFMFLSSFHDKPENSYHCINNFLFCFLKGSK
jgi:hypothetical protein